MPDPVHAFYTSFTAIALKTQFTPSASWLQEITLVILYIKIVCSSCCVVCLFVFLFVFLFSFSFREFVVAVVTPQFWSCFISGMASWVYHFVSHSLVLLELSPGLILCCCCCYFLLLKKVSRGWLWLFYRKIVLCH